MPDLKELLEPEIDQDFGNKSSKVISAGFSCQFDSFNQAMVDAPKDEVVRALKKIIANIENSDDAGSHGRVIDVNGNTMGRWNFWIELGNENGETSND